MELQLPSKGKGSDLACIEALETSGSWARAARMASKRLALELAAAWLPPDCLVPFAAASKELKALIESNSFWTDFYRRRFPCLAALPGYASPKDARGFVKALLHRVPVDRKYFQPEGSDFGTKPIPKPEVSVPVDAQGRPVPFGTDAVLVAQLVHGARGAGNYVHYVNFPLSAASLASPRLAWRPLGVEFQARLADVTIHVRETSLGKDVWRFDVSSKPVPSSTQELLQTTFSLSETPMIIGDSEAAGELIGPIKEVERRLRDELKQEVFVVTGDAIYRLDEPRCLDFPDAWRMKNVIYNSREKLGNPPRFSVNAQFCHTNFAMECIYTLGSYVARHPYLAREGDPFVMDHQFDVLNLRVTAVDHCSRNSISPFCYGIYSPSDDPWQDDDDVERDAWNWYCNFMCQLLAAADPARFPR